MSVVLYYNCQEGKALDKLSQPRWDTRPKSRCVATSPILSRELPFEKKLRFFSKTLLTSSNRCAIIKAQRARERQPAERADPRESVRPLLQDPYRTVSLCAVYKCEPTPLAEKMLGLRRVHKPNLPLRESR